jgi:hypothetical protein
MKPKGAKEVTDTRVKFRIKTFRVRSVIETRLLESGNKKVTEIRLLESIRKKNED